MNLKWFVKQEPVILGGILTGLGVFFGVRYGSHSTAALQGSLGLGSASFISFLSRFVGPSSVSDVQGIANDVASLKEQIGPLPKTGGLGGVAKWLAQLAAAHGKNLEAIVEAAKADIEDLIHQTPSFDPKAAVTVAEPPATTTTVAPLTLTPTVAEPVSEAPTPVAEDAVAELAKLVP